MAVPRPTNEQERLEALRSYEILDTEPEAAFDDLTRVAAAICDVPIALLTFVEDDRQWIKSRTGIEADETSREHAFCAHAILDDQTLVVPDATLDDRFADNPYVLADPNIRFYAGAPLKTPQGHNLGALCVIDREPRGADRPLSDVQKAALEALSRQAARLLEFRRVTAQLASALERVNVLERLVPLCAWCGKVQEEGEYRRTLRSYLEQHPGFEISHGICESCAEKVESEL